MRAVLRFLRRSDPGQDVAEFCLITALVALVGLALFVHLSGGIQGLWNSANASLASGQAAATTGGTGAAPASSPSGPAH